MKKGQTMHNTIFLYPETKKLPYQYDMAIDHTVVVFDSYSAFERYETPEERSKSRREIVLGAKEYLIIDTYLSDNGLDKPTMTLELMRFNYDD